MDKLGLSKDIVVERYRKEKKEEWDRFVSNSKNGHFLFYRDYMEYHSDRFVDYSLMFYEGNSLIGLLPANLEGKTLVSHGGLTFGGLVTNTKMKVSRMLSLFDAMIAYLKKDHIERIIYKRVPYIYHVIPSDEDLYALFLKGARLIRRDISSAVYLPEKPRFQEIRKRSFKKARAANLEVKVSTDFETYWKILEENLLERHGTRPVHSLKEIRYLHNRFFNNIILFASYENQEMLAGVVIYESKNVAHAQYIASNKKGRDLGALDAIFFFLISDYYKGKKRYFDFGISTERNGLFLNKGLIFFKEGFGARAVAYDFYEVTDLTQKFLS